MCTEGETFSNIAIVSMMADNCEGRRGKTRKVGAKKMDSEFNPSPAGPAIGREWPMIYGWVDRVIH